MFTRRHIIRRVAASVLALALFLTGATGAPGGVAPPGRGIPFISGPAAGQQPPGDDHGRNPGPVPPVLPFLWYADTDDWYVDTDDPEEDRDKR
jgi:hypothetical protein